MYIRKKPKLFFDGISKECNKCHNILIFNKETFAIKSGKLTSSCKDCYNIHQRKYRKNNPEKAKNWDRDSWRKNKINKSNSRKKWYQKNRDKVLTERKTPEYKSQRNSALRSKYHSNIAHKLEQNLRNRVYLAIRDQRGFKSGRSKELIGCNYEFLINYLKSKFTPNMNWQNYLDGEIHIDHITPCANFDLTIDSEQRKCFHYSNLQPLWATSEIAIKHGEPEDYIGNINKGKKILCHL